MIHKSGSANWKGALKEGAGLVSTESGVLDMEKFSFSKRFGEEPGTNPEELIGAAHASCFSMALSMVLGEAGHRPDHISTEATVSLEEADGGFAITRSHLQVSAQVPGVSEEGFAKAAETAKTTCPVSRLLDAEITMEAVLTDS
jgi:osmotically inducible protein OsmC